MPVPTAELPYRSCHGTPICHVAADLSGLAAPQRAARSLGRDALAGPSGPACVDDVVLVADELVGNAIRHVGTATIGIALERYDWGVVVRVRDGGTDAAAVPKEPSPAGMDDEHGRGLLLVDLLTSAWQVQRDDGGKRIVAVFLTQAGDIT